MERSSRRVRGEHITLERSGRVSWQKWHFRKTWKDSKDSDTDRAGEDPQKEQGSRGGYVRLCLGTRRWVVS